MTARRWRQAGAALAVVCGLAMVVGAAEVGASAAPPSGDPSVTRVEVIGDSLSGSPGCWRAPLWVALTDADLDVDMVGIRTENECGDVVNQAGAAWDPDNTGIGGVTTTRMWVKLARDGVLEQTQPDVIVQLLGTNDLLGGASVDDILTQYDALLTLYRDHNPQIALVIAAPPPIATGACGCDDVQAAVVAALPAWAQAASTDESPIYVADLTTGFDPEADTVDGIHPNDVGTAKLAAGWTPAVTDAVTAAGAGGGSVTVWIVWGLAAVGIVALAVFAATTKARRTS